MKTRVTLIAVAGAVVAVAAAVHFGRSPYDTVRASSSSPQRPAWPPRERVEPIYGGEIIDTRISELLPADAAEYAENYRYCRHWAGEEPYDEERAKEIEKGLESCDGLDAARDSLRIKYPRGSSVDSTLRAVIAGIDDDSDDYAWSDPGHSSKVLNRYYEASGQRTPGRVDELVAKWNALSDTASQATRSMVQYMIQVETRDLKDLFANLDRLHPQTAAEVREARTRWERETGERIGKP